MREFLSITDEPKTLPAPAIAPGNVAKCVARNCDTVRGAVETVLCTDAVGNNGDYVGRVLNIMNENRVQHAMNTAEAELDREDHPSKRVKVDDGELPQKKGHPGFKHSKSTPRAKRAETRRRGRSARAKRNRSEGGIFWATFERWEFYCFLAILLYAGQHKSPTWHSYWDTGSQPDSPIHRFPSSVMARDRFFEMLACFTFTDAQLKELEPILEQHLRAIWEPANAAVVDESVVAHKGRANPHHVFIMRKPKPHGIKVRTCVFSFYQFHL